MMKIIIDKHIPFIRGVFEPFALVEYHAGKDINTDVVKDADALIIRTRTKCNHKLLSGSKVKFIASATIGYDHIDTAFCEANGIQWTNAPGCNADSVAQYVASVMAYWTKQNNISYLGDKVMGVVGVGNVGKRVVELAQMLNMRVLCSDPFVSHENYTGVEFCSLEDIAKNADVISFHTPLTFSGDHPSYHLCDERIFDLMEKAPLLINAARGGVVDEDALKSAIENGLVGYVALDCWEEEPEIDLSLLDIVDIASPHIAGYSADGKLNGSRMAVNALCDSALFDALPSNISVEGLSDKEVLDVSHNTILSAFIDAYDVMRDSNLLKHEPEEFESQRGNYPVRREKLYNLL